MTSGVSTPPAPSAPRPVVVDTSVWISWLIPTDANNAAATAWLVGHTNGGGEMLAPSFLLAEIAGAVRRITGSESDALALVNTLENFPPLTIIRVNNSMMLEAVKVAVQ